LFDEENINFNEYNGKILTSATTGYAPAMVDVPGVIAMRWLRYGRGVVGLKILVRMTRGR
jgi:hypothetical protein